MSFWKGDLFYYDNGEGYQIKSIPWYYNKINNIVRLHCD